MLQALLAISITLHTLATVVLVGHHALLALIYLPALTAHGFDPSVGTHLSEISRRSRSWLYGSFLVFVLTGIHLMLVSSNYLGIGNFSNAWSLLMLLKHLVVLAMIVMGWWFNSIWRVGPMMISNAGAARALARLRWYAKAMTVAGVVVVFLTGVSQIQ